MLEDVGLSLNLLKMFVQHRVALLAQQCRTMLASFEQVLTLTTILATYNVYMAISALLHIAARLHSRAAERRWVFWGVLIGWRQTLTTSPPNHIRFLLVRAKKIANWKTGLKHKTETPLLSFYNSNLLN